MRRPRQLSRSSRLAGAAYAAAFTILAGLLLVDVDVSLVAGVNDDAGYYFRIARNEVRGLGRTFDWIHPTNGFNPLFEFLCAAAFARIDVDSTDTCYRVGVGITLVFSILAFVLFAALVRRAIALSAPGPFPRRLFHACLCFDVAWVIFKEYYGLDAFPALFFLLAFVVLHGSGWNRGSMLRSACAGILALLANLARLDSVSFSAAFFAYFALLVVSGRLAARHLLAFALPLVLGLGVYLRSNLEHFGLLLPISAGLKNSFPVIDVATAFRTIHHTSSHFLNGVVFYVSGSAGLGVCVASWKRIAGLRRGVPFDPWWELMFPLSLYAFGHTLFYSLFSRFDFQASYIIFLNVYVLLVVVSVLRAPAVVRRVGRQRLVTVLATGLFVAAAGLIAARVVRLAAGWSRGAPNERTLGREIEARTGPGDILFGEHFGLVGFFTERAFVNGDGVVNDREYLAYRTAGGDRLAEYLDREGVTHVFGSADGRILGADAPVCSLVAEWVMTPRYRLRLCRRPALRR